MRTRGYQAGDLPGLLKLFRETVQAVGARHYTQQELAAWAPKDLRTEDWAPRLERNTALVAEDDGLLVGFSELSPDGAIDMIYVHKNYQGQGIASALLAELETSARTKGLTRLTTNVSRVAKPFFLSRGFTLLAARTVERRGVRIENFRMKKILAP
jgi:putative acetyltransferase